MVITRKADGMTVVQFESSKERVTQSDKLLVMVSGLPRQIHFGEITMAVYERHPEHDEVVGPLVMIELPTAIAQMHGL